MFTEIGLVPKARIYLALMSSEADTKPTIETVLERIDALGKTLHAEMQDFRASVEKRLDDFDVRIDRIEGQISKTRAEMLDFRADFKEMRAGVRKLDEDLRAHLARFNQPT